MSRRRREDDNLLNDVHALLLMAPIWVGPVLAAVAYLVFRFGWPTLIGGSGPAAAPMASIGPAFAPWICLIVLVLWIVAEFQKWQRRTLLDAQGDLETIRNLSWQEFEHLVGEAYRRRGYIVEETGTTGGDGGIDLILSGNNETILVQCKQWRTRRVGVKPVRELFGVLTSERADRAILATCESFTDEARAFADGKPVELVVGDALLELVRSGQRHDAQDQPRAGTAASGSTATAADSSANEQRPDPPSCPRCGAAMVRRTAKRGPNPGSQFWGCPKYPACRGTRP